jgi:hypothetical protein
MIDFPPDAATAGARKPRLASLVTLPDGRRVGVCWDEKPRCVTGHRFHTKDPKRVRQVRIDLLEPCHHRPYKEGPLCGVLQLATLCSIPGTGERFWISVELTDAHRERLLKEPMIFLQRMALLGCALPGVEIDLLGVQEG